MNINEIINYRALSRYLTGGETNIHRNHTPNKYKLKMKLLMYFIDMWSKLIKEDLK